MLANINNVYAVAFYQSVEHVYDGVTLRLFDETHRIVFEATHRKDKPRNLWKVAQPLIVTFY